MQVQKVRGDNYVYDIVCNFYNMCFWRFALAAVYHQVCMERLEGFSDSCLPAATYRVHGSWR